VIYLLHQSIDHLAARDPDKAAFCIPGQSLSYGEMAASTNQLAHLLAEHGVERGDRVGIFTPRGLESAIAVYGILKAGAAFVPIDPQLPSTALARLVDDCGIRVLVTHNAQKQVINAYAAEHTALDLVVGLDSAVNGIATLSWSQLDQFPAAAAPSVRATEGDLAYIMYSSGSTGTPKGIMHTHRSGLAYARLSADVYGISGDDRIANHSPLHFDMSTLGYFTAMYAGATTVMIPEAYTKIAASLAQLLEAQGVTIWYSVPLALIQLLQRGLIETRDLSRIRWVLFGGEPFPVKHLQELMRRWPQARFSNVYGPAEVNQCTYYHIPRDSDGEPQIDTDQPVPLGAVWQNTEGLILAPDDTPVVPGAEGELVICSPTMMHGYWGRPELNAHAFYRQPLYEGFDKVYYRTGDLVRTREDGELLFLGRMDRQVKVRGYRIELDDIEHALTLHPGVEEAAVYPVKADGGVNHIEASVLARGGGSLEPEALKAHLAQRISAYAVPGRIWVRKEFPRTTSGKIDRRALQAAAENPTTVGT